MSIRYRDVNGTPTTARIEAKDAAIKPRYQASRRVPKSPVYCQIRWVESEPQNAEPFHPVDRTGRASALHADLRTRCLPGRRLHRLKTYLADA